jgi:hypothetical protein
MTRKLTKVALSAAVLLGGMQFLRPVRTNPPADPAASFEALLKPPQETAVVVKRACGDCHSNETVWPWYSKIAPVSWVVADDVKQGRAHLNLSEWNRLSPEMSQTRIREMCREAKEGGMPLFAYRLIHPAAKLSASDVAAICSAPVAKR